MIHDARRGSLRDRILTQLATVIDPETGVDVVRMRLIEDLFVDDQGYVTYKFRPSSLVCPLAVVLSYKIKTTVADVPGVTGQHIQVVGYIQDEVLTEWLNSETDTQ